MHTARKRRPQPLPTPPTTPQACYLSTTPDATRLAPMCCGDSSTRTAPMAAPVAAPAAAHVAAPAVAPVVAPAPVMAPSALTVT